MNKHFEDARYYLKRATETAAQGVKEELEPIEEKFREITGREKPPEGNRLDAIREDLERLEERAEGEAREAIKDARERIKQYRQAA